MSSSHLNAKKINLDRLEVGKKDANGIVKELEAGVRTSDVEDQNLVCQTEENSGQRLDKAVQHCFSKLSQTSEFSQQEKITPSPSQQIDNLADCVGVEEQLVVDSNQQIDRSKDAQLGQKLRIKKRMKRPMILLKIPVRISIHWRDLMMLY